MADMALTGAVNKTTVSAAAPAPVSSALQGQKRFASAMAFLTGWGQLATYFKYQTFSTMMTGNTMWMALAAVEGRVLDVLYYMSVILSYLFGQAAFRRSDLTLKSKSLTFVCAPLVLMLFVGSDVLMKILQQRWLPISMLAFGFGIINSVGQEVAGTLTFVITGHYSRLSHQIVDRFSKTAGRKKFRNEATVKNVVVVLSFIAGIVMAGATKNCWPALWSRSFTVLGILYASLFLWQDRDTLKSGWWLRKNGDWCDVDDDGETCD